MLVPEVFWLHTFTILKKKPQHMHYILSAYTHVHKRYYVDFLWLSYIGVSICSRW